MSPRILLPDYHMHTTLCKHAEGAMADYIERAIDAGVAEMGFSEHMPFMPEPDFCMGYDELRLYRNAVFELRERYAGRMTVRYGCEIDIVHELRDEIRAIVDAEPFDYVIGSIHYLGGWPFDQNKHSGVFGRESIDAIYARFFEAIEAGLGTGLYDIVGHIDNIKRMGYRPASPPDALYDSVAGLCAARDVSVEVNTSGFDHPCGEQYPSLGLLRALNSRGVPVTVGSDAHAPDQVARHFDRIAPLLKQAGYDSVAIFEGRRRTLVPFASTEGGEDA